MDTLPEAFHCSQCGHEIPANRWVCPSCGAYVHILHDKPSPSGGVITGSLSLPVHRPSQENEPMKRPSFERYGLYTLGLLFIMIAIIIAWILGYLPSSSQSFLPKTSEPLDTQPVLRSTDAPDGKLELLRESTPPTPLPTIANLLPEVDVQPLPGDELMQITNSTNRDYSPALTRDQRRLVYSSEVDGVWQIVEADPKSGVIIKQITSGITNYYTPSFSADGKNILIASNWNGNMDIFLISADTGKNVKELTNDPANDYAPNWLPDYSGIVFTSQRDGNAEIYLLKLAASGQEQGDPIRLTDNAAFDGYPAVSTSGEEIIFYSDRDEEYNYEIYIMPLSTLKPRRLTNNPARDAMPVFSPGDAWVVFESNRDGNYDLYALRLDEKDESNLRNLTNNPTGDYMPVFSPDGFWLLFLSNRSGNMDIYRQPWP